MDMRMIENSDRGITLNKTLAWTMAVGLMGAAFYLGTELAHTRTALGQIVTAMANERLESARRADALDTRVRFLETSQAAGAGEISALRRDLTDFRRELREATALLRGQGR